MPKPTSRVPSLADLEAELQIDPHALEDEWVKQPDAFYRVSKELALAISHRDAAKQDLAETEAKVDAEIRHDAQVAEEKITEKSVESEKARNKDVLKAKDELARLNHLVGQWSALKEAFQQRSFALRDLVALYIANYYTTSEVKDARTRDVKAEMSRARRGRD